MHARFEEMRTLPENDIFRVVFFPDRVYHARYLNATRSTRYRYNVREVRSKHDILVMKGQVYLDGELLTNFLRLEYRAGRLVETAREKNRFLRHEVRAWIRAKPREPDEGETQLTLTHCRWIDAWQVEIWQTLEPPANKSHDIQVLDMMGRHGSITRVPAFDAALVDLAALRRLEFAFREALVDHPFGYPIGDADAAWDNNFLRSHQVPNTQEPSSQQNTVDTPNYLVDFQRGFTFRSQDIDPVRYRNAMMNDGDPQAKEDNIIEMRWLLQRELGGSLVFFHDVTIPRGKVEGTHRHIGSEEVYFVYAGRGFAYMGDGDDPSADQYELVERPIFGLDSRPCRKIPVEPGSVIYTKSGGIHGIENTGRTALKFVAFLYQGS